MRTSLTMILLALGLSFFTACDAPQENEAQNQGDATNKVAVAFGTYLGEFNGVQAYSNGSLNYVATQDPRNTSPRTSYGIKYQCAEYVARYYSLKYGKNLTGLNANSFYSSASARGLYAFPNGGTTAPRVGDVITMSGGSWGHVGVIREVGTNFIRIIQQNWSLDARDANYQIPMSVANGKYTVNSPGSGYNVQGWLSTSAAPIKQGFVSAISFTTPSSATRGTSFTVSATLRETNGGTITLPRVALGVNNSNGTYLFDCSGTQSNVSFSAHQSRTVTFTCNIQRTLAAGTYQLALNALRPATSSSWFNLSTRNITVR